MRRTVFDEDHEAFRTIVRDFLTREVVPVFPEWEKAGAAPRDFYRQVGKLGILGMLVPEEYGGGGQRSFKFNAVVNEELARAKLGLGTVRVHADIVTPYLLRYADEEQKRRWLPGVASGELMTAIAMTEPGTGSDLAGIASTAVRDGDHYVLNGAKTFITGAVNADLVLVVARTSPPSDNRRTGLSILVVETASPGFTVGRNLAKIGLKAQDTAELAFEDVPVPVANLLGEEGRAFDYLGHNLAQERLSIAVNAQAAAVAAVELTVAYVRDRSVFGRPLSGFQNTKFVLAECATDVEAGQALVDRALEEHDGGGLSAADAAKVKLFCTELQSRVVDKCLQLHGGYGYVLEYPIARMYADARVTRIFGGTSEVMKTIIAKSVGL
ncbi:acyl-CoA dehydrogenase family protein [Nonomuraea aurantiaca]|uniref:acyl-CoA dehydrogenase family protein n=1 Tax=Nonomuraea aurantiaca TaxID=2878562 RepID=UPI001CD9EB87|nr:acyl-CoA dehydrogenase family protein [Nonomuraea aurantiaca]MCA2226401.1 acyl-CoA dehydrogenase family protein [Nonomuraea aurantiaca]